MKVPKAKSWARLVVCYWLVMAVVFFFDFKYMESGWAGLPGFLLTLPLSAMVVTVGLLPAVAFRYGYQIPLDVTDYQFEYAFIVCAFLNALVFYPLYLLWVRRKEPKVFDSPPPPPNKSFSLDADRLA